MATGNPNSNTSIVSRKGYGNLPLSAPAHTLSTDEVGIQLGADVDDGLTEVEALSRLEKYGKNELKKDKGAQPGRILVRQVFNSMTLVCTLRLRELAQS
jgi:P-type Na+/K+ transporter